MSEQRRPEKRPWWTRLWHWRPTPYRSRLDRLPTGSQGDATNHWLRGGR